MPDADTVLSFETHPAILHGRKLLSQARDVEAADVFESLTLSNGDESPQAWAGLAEARYNLGERDRARAALTRGLEWHPGHVSLLYALGRLNLAEGNWREGWSLYELRLKSRQACYLPRRASYPRWRGESLMDKSFLIWGEQGYGDEILFAGFARYLMVNRTHVTLECARELRALFERSFPGAEVVARDFNGAMPPELTGRGFDYECPAGSLPHVSGCLPSTMRLFSYLEPARAEADAERLAWQNEFRPSRVVGISWRGGTLATRRAARSIPLDQFCAPLKNFPSVLFVNLQHDANPQECNYLNATLPKCVPAQPPKNLDATASLVEACDSILTACGTLVHLAGAMGKPVRVIAPFSPEWRYGVNGLELPWYRDARIYRQTSYGSWRNALARAVAVAC